MAPAVDIITLDNFEAKLPKWTASDKSSLHALVDMGSNGIRFTISDLAAPRTRLLPCVYRERAGISLFDALKVDATAPPPSSPGALQAMVLPDETIAQVARALARFYHTALAYGVAPEHMSVFATEAMRRASNAGTLLEAINKSAPGFTVHVLAPAVETLFGSTGARAGFSSVDGGLMLDLGGGSVQMTYVDSRLGTGYEVAAAQAGQSMPYGAARLTRMAAEAAAASGKSVDSAKAQAKATAAAAPNLADDMSAALARLHVQFPALKAADSLDVYLCGGGFRGYGSMLMHNDSIQPYPIPLMAGYSVSGTFFSQTERMRRVNHEYEGKIFGMSKRRRVQFAAIATVVDALLEALQRAHHSVRSVTFCAGGNREGALMMRIPPAVRESDPLAALASASAVPASVHEALLSALPKEIQSQTLLVRLLPIIASRIWERNGADTTANAAFALHEAVHRDAGLPGLPHRARAAIAISLWTRWGGGVAPTDQVLLSGLRNLLAYSRDSSSDGEDHLLDFWAEYIGGVAAVLALVHPAQPSAADDVAQSVRFTPVLALTKSAKGKDRRACQLRVAVKASHAVGLDLAPEVESCFGTVGKQHKKIIEVDVRAEEFE